MEETGLGRTPVREALQTLARNRLVEIHPHKGILIPPTSVESELRMLELRRVMEVLAVRLACERSTAQERREMRVMVDHLESGLFSLRTYAETVKDTHQIIVAGAHNSYLADAIAPLQVLSRRFWVTHVRDEAGEISTASRWHQTILNAIISGDSDGAETASLGLNAYLVNFALATLSR